MDRLGGTSSNLLYFSTESGNLRYGPPHLISRRPLMADGDDGYVDIVLRSDAVQLVRVALDRVVADWSRHSPNFTAPHGHTGTPFNAWSE